MKRLTLKQARTAKGWTQERLEAASGVSQSSIAKYENSPDADPAVSIALKLERALGLKRGTLLFGAGRSAAA